MILRQYLENHYPELVGGVTGGMYPPPQNALVLAQVMQMVQFIIIPFMFFGDSVLEMLGITQPPVWYKSFQENKMTVFMFVWVGNSIAQNMCSTGAFEISHNDELIFSKLHEQRMPSIEEIVRILAKRGLRKR